MCMRIPRIPTLLSFSPHLTPHAQAFKLFYNLIARRSLDLFRVARRDCVLFILISFHVNSALESQFAHPAENRIKHSSVCF